MSIAADSYGIVYFSYNHPRITANVKSNKNKYGCKSTRIFVNHQIKSTFCFARCENCCTHETITLHQGLQLRILLG